MEVSAQEFGALKQNVEILHQEVMSLRNTRNELIDKIYNFIRETTDKGRERLEGEIREVVLAIEKGDKQTLESISKSIVYIERVRDSLPFVEKDVKELLEFKKDTATVLLDWKETITKVREKDDVNTKIYVGVMVKVVGWGLGIAAVLYVIFSKYIGG